ncbi:MAG TPA: hypothetical protein VJU14_10975 [Solirubrobacterales bacterium]|nr:hypothetical protein [Solirubrobacterales bacterium]
MSLTDKESLLPLRVAGRRRSSRLTTEDEAVQLQSARLEIEGEDGEVRTYLQVKFWGKTRGWSMVILDSHRRLVAMAGPRSQEFACWKECVRTMKAQGLWTGEVPS